MTREELKNYLIETDDLSFYKLVVWGTGNTASLYHEGLARLEQEGVKVYGYCDSNSEKWGQEFNGKCVYSPDEIKEIENVLALITSPRPKVIEEIGNILDHMSIMWRHIDDFIFKSHAKELLACFDLLQDERSKQVYSELIRCRMEGKYPSEEIIDSEQYFSIRSFVDQDEQRVFIDCGAYVGDSVEQYVWKTDGVFSKIIAFEPDERNLNSLNHRLERIKLEWNLPDSKIIVFPYGLSDERATKYIERYSSNNGLGSKLKSDASIDSKECISVTIDQTITYPFSFLKADIESYEYRMLLGAKKSIQQYSPRLAICIYHNAVDFYSILLLLHQFNPRYHFSVRHYAGYISETVLYAFE